MEQFVDEKFYTRADSFIDLANENVRDTERNMVSGSMMYASARFNAWISATGCKTGKELHDAKQARIAVCLELYRAMLDENIDSYIKNFGDYMQPDA